MFTLYVDGEPIETDTINDPDGCRIQLSDDATSSGFGPYCAECGDEIEDDPTSSTGYTHTHDPQRVECDGCYVEVTRDASGAWHHAAEPPEGWLTHDPAPEEGWHDATPAPLGWANSASITTHPDTDAITVSISTGDPRGAFCWTIRRIADGDHPNARRLVMHTPYPGEPLPHDETSHLHPGTLLIGTPSAPAEPTPEAVALAHIAEIMRDADWSDVLYDGDALDEIHAVLTAAGLDAGDEDGNPEDGKA